MNMWKVLSSHKLVDNCERVSNSICVWLERPNVCCKMLSCCKLENLVIDAENEDFSNVDQILPLPTLKFAQYLLQSSKETKCPSCQGHKQFHNDQTSCFGTKTFLRKLIPKRHDIYKISHELIVQSTSCYIFIPLHSESFLPALKHKPYMLLFSNICFSANDPKACVDVGYATLSVSILSGGEALLNTLDVKNITEFENAAENKNDCFVTNSWLSEKLFPIICHWCEESNQTNSRFQSTLPRSLSLIDQEKYSTLYQNLKQKYGVPLLQVWPEVTDPQKFIYEDVAIATYLLLLWEKETLLSGKTSKQSFADLGCGNGLLVHILSSEGHPGIGYDIRRRKIWNMLDKSSPGALKETTVTPDRLDLIKDYDWILGNHSDELTPWIPVMATRCDFNKRFWILPCCFHDLYAKYERNQSANSQYHDYLDYIKSIGVKCGYAMDTDVMRIPSTKRVCFVGMTKTYEQPEHDSVVKNVDVFVQEKLSLASKSTQAFNPRPAHIEVRNCTKINRDIQKEVVSTIIKHLLSYSNQIQLKTGKIWNRGGKISLSDAMGMLSDSARTTMKNEYGGLQTLLRNHNQLWT